MKIGQIYYVKKLRNRLGGGSFVEGILKNKVEAIVMTIGLYESHTEQPTKANYHRMVGNVGFISFDDVAKVLGDKSAKKLIKFVEKNYPEYDRKKKGTKK